MTCELPEGAATSAKELQRFIDSNSHRVALDAVDVPSVLLECAAA